MRNYTELLLLISCIFLALVSSQVKAENSQTIDELRKHTIDLSKEVSSISVTYKETIKGHRLNTSSVNRTIKVDFAAFGEYRLMAVTDTDESTIDLTSVYNGTDFFQIHPTQVAQLPKKDSAIDNCLYCIESLFLKIRDSHRSQDGSPFLFPGCLTDSYKVLREEKFGDANCVVVSNGPDTIWIDVSRPVYTIKKRELGRQQSIGAQFEYQYEDYKEVDGFWIPMRAVRGQRFAEGFPVPTDGIPWESMEWVVESISLNKLDESFFDVVLPSGALFIGDNIVFPIGGVDEQKISDLTARKSRPSYVMGRWRVFLFLVLVLLTLVVTWRLRMRKQ